MTPTTYRLALEQAETVAALSRDVFLETGNPAHKEVLLRLRDRYAAEPSITAIVASIEPEEPFVNVLPLAVNSTTEVVRQILEEGRNFPTLFRRSTYRFVADEPEYPSAFAALRSFAQAKVDLQVSYRAEARPLDQAPPFALWSYRGDEAVPTLPRPRNDIAEAISQIAAVPFHQERYRLLADSLAARLEKIDGSLQLLAAMVHPPAVPEHSDPLLWSQKVQVAAALTIARLEPGLLEVVALGPTDAVCESAILALAYSADTSEAAAERAHRVFTILSERRTAHTRRARRCFDAALDFARGHIAEIAPQVVSVRAPCLPEVGGNPLAKTMPMSRELALALMRIATQCATSPAKPRVAAHTLRLVGWPANFSPVIAETPQVGNFVPSEA